MKHHYQEIERMLDQLMQKFGSELSPEIRAEVAEYRDVGEYGLALETMAVDLIALPYPWDRADFDVTARMMNFDPETLLAEALEYRKIGTRNRIK
jgi:hypothetical protein